MRGLRGLLRRLTSSMSRGGQIDTWWLHGSAVLVCAAIGMGVVGLQQLPVWEAIMVGFLVFGLAMCKHRGPGHPLAWMPTLYSLYFLIGAQNWVQPGGTVGFRGHVDLEATLRLAAIGLLPFCIGAAWPTTAYGSKASNRAAPRASRLQPRVAGLVLLSVGMVGLLLSIRKTGLPILHPAVRAQADHGITALMAYALVPGALLLTVAQKSVKREMIVIAVCSALILLLAYRTPVVLLNGTYVLTKVIRKEIRGRALIAAGVGLVAFSLLVFVYRAESLGRQVINPAVRATGPVAHSPVLFVLYLGFPREGVAVFARIHELVPATTPYFGGRVQLSGVGTPGEKLSPRQYVTDLVYGTAVAPTTLTPTILGAPYLDFGVAGIVGEMFIFGWLTGALYRRGVVRQRESVWGPLAYAYWTTLMIVSIHSGALDRSAFVVVPGLVVLALLATARPARQAEPGASRVSVTREPDARQTSLGRVGSE